MKSFRENKNNSIREELFRPLTEAEDVFFMGGLFFFLLNSFLIHWVFTHAEQLDIFYRGELIPTSYFIFFLCWNLFITLPLPFFVPYEKYHSVVLFHFVNILNFLFLVYLIVKFYELEENGAMLIDLNFIEIKRSIWTFDKLSLLFDQELERLNLESTLKEKMISLKPKILERVDDREQLLNRFYSNLRKLKYSNDDF